MQDNSVPPVLNQVPPAPQPTPTPPPMPTTPANPIITPIAPKKGNTGFILFVLGLIIVAAIAIGAVYFLVINKNKTATQNTSTVNQQAVVTPMPSATPITTSNVDQS